jgi:large subunit ribosomal protein L24
MSLTGQGRSISGLAGALSGGGTLSLQDARIAGLDPRAFEVAVRAGDAGQPTDDLKLKELVDPVLAAGGLTVPSAQIPFSIRDGRLRVETTTLEAARARVAVAGGYDLPADQADIRAVMTPVTTRPISGRPEIRVDLNGSPDRLARTVDVAALSSWLAMRAIDRETRRLDQLERGVTLAPESSDLWDEPLPQVEPLSPGEVKVPARDPRRKNSGTKAPAPRPAVPPQASKAAPQAPAAPTGSASAPPLPPPIDIRPAPGILHAPKQRPATAPSASGGAF